MTARRWAGIGALSLGHFVATIVVFFAAVGDAVGRMNTGASAPFGSTVLHGLAATLLFPLGIAAYLAHWMGAGYIGWMPVALNSLLWGTVLYWGGEKALASR